MLQQFLFGDEDKEMLVRMSRKCADFSGIDILAFAVLDNHFHLLVHLPSPSVIPEEEVIRRIGVLYGAAYADDTERRWKEYREGTLARLAEEELDHFRSRMGDVSQFMQILKQRFSLWYRSSHGDLAGTIWQSRFNSTIVEDDWRALSAVAAYIDLNPVRAGIVKDPKDYRWSSFGASSAGVSWARRGYKRMFAIASIVKDFMSLYSSYTELLYQKGADVLDEETLKAILANHGRLTPSQFVHCKVRYFTAGVAIGSKLFVENVFAAFRDRFGSRRQTGARRIPSCESWDGTDLCTLRNLQINPVSINPGNAS